MSAATAFRDPGGFCVALNGHILRVIDPAYVAQVEGFLNSPCGRKFQEAGVLIPTRLLTKAEVSQWLQNPEFSRAVDGHPIGAVFEHERIEFPGFPCEWSPEMLYAAGELTLDLASSALASGYNLKDATPHNILFRGTKPVFVDLLSFEPRVSGQTIWKPYAQFVRTFLLPLLANKYWGTSLAEIFTTHRDGLQPEALYARCTLLQKLRPPFLNLITIPTILSARGSDERIYKNEPIANDDKARFIADAFLRRLRATLTRLRPAGRKSSTWAGYMASHNYEPKSWAAKETFVQSALAEFKPATVLDVGANTGHFSRSAAGRGASVVAIDADADCVGQSFVAAQSEWLDVLSLVVDIARPTPAMGWRNTECASFLDRARGRFDAVLMLALAHHLSVTERVPLPEIFNLAAELTRSLLIIEFVPADDPMFKRLLRGRDALFADYNRELFETACQRLFDIVRASELPGTGRRIYVLRKR